MAKYDPELKQAILEVVENQLRDRNPPESKQTYDRLRKQGVSDYNARILIGQVITCEIFDTAKKQEKFNHKRFVERLNKLPNEPFDD